MATDNSLPLYSVYYSGGSGGYMFFWSLQLALGYNVQDTADKNWNIKSFNKWVALHPSNIQAMLHNDI